MSNVEGYIMYMDIHLCPYYIWCLDIKVFIETTSIL